MVKRLPQPKPLAIGVIGTGEASVESIEAQLNDFTSPHEDVSFILPVSDEYWSPSHDAVYAWITANDLPYVAITNGTSPGKKLTKVAEGADQTLKVARISTKMVQMLKGQKDEGEEAALLVLWEDEDAEAVQAVNKALQSDVPAFNLTDALDPFTFDDEDEEDAAEVAEQGLKTDVDDDEPEAPAPAAAKVDEYDTWGVRKLRAALRERMDEHDLTDKMIGGLDKDDCIRALRNCDNGRGKAPATTAAAVEAAAENDVVDTPAVLDESIPETRTRRARRAFAEGAAEGTGDEAQTLPKSRGADILENEGDEDDKIVAVGVVDKGFTNEPATTEADPNAGSFEDAGLRLEALRLLGPIEPSQVAEAIAAANRLVGYVKGERRSPGRPRADGSPAQPRDIDPETGKVRRRRPTRAED